MIMGSEGLKLKYRGEMRHLRGRDNDVAVQ